VHDPTDEGGNSEGPSESSGDFGKLVTKLDVVVVWPSTVNLGTVKSGDRCLSEKGSHHGSNHSTDTVRGKDVKSLVNTEEELELGCEITSGSSDESDSDSGRSTDETSSGSDTDETSDSSGAESDNRPLSFKSVIPKHPGKTTDRGGKVGNDTSHTSSHVGTESGSTVESEPAEPKEDCAENDIGSVVGLVGESLGSVSPSLAEVECDGEGSGTGRDVDGRTTSEVESTESSSPTVETPGPGGDRAVDDSQPDKDEDHDGSDSCSFSETTGGEDDGDESKHSLVGGVDDGRESGRSNSGLSVDTHQTEVLQCTDEC